MEGIKSRQIKWHPKINKISQIPNEGLEYALISDNYEQIHQLVWCKDFLQDAIYGFLSGTCVEIYGFKYDPATSPSVSMNRTRLIVTNWKDREFSDKIVHRVLPLLHEVEQILGMSKTVLERTVKVPSRYGYSGVWLFDSSIRWSKAPPMISLFTLLLRIGLVRDPADSLKVLLKKIKNGSVECYFSSEYDEDDQLQVKMAVRGILHILKHGDRKLFHPTIKKNYQPSWSIPKDKEALTKLFHNSSGIVSYSTMETEFTFPYWHRFDEVNE